MQAEAARADALRELRGAGLGTWELVAAHAEMRAGGRDAVIPDSLPSAEGDTIAIRVSLEARLREAQDTVGGGCAATGWWRKEEGREGGGAVTTVTEGETAILKPTSVSLPPQKLPLVALERALARASGDVSGPALRVILWRVLLRYRAMGMRVGEGGPPHPGFEALAAKHGATNVWCTPFSAAPSAKRYYGIFPALEAIFGCAGSFFALRPSEAPPTMLLHLPSSNGIEGVSKSPVAYSVLLRALTAKCAELLEGAEVTIVAFLPDTGDDRRVADFESPVGAAAEALRRSRFVRWDKSYEASRFRFAAAGEARVRLVLMSSARAGHGPAVGDVLEAFPDPESASIADAVSGGVLREVTLPARKNTSYLKRLVADVARHVPFPYMDALVTEAEVRAAFERLRALRRDFRAEDGAVVRYLESDFEINRMVDFFTERCRMRCSVRGAPSPLARWTDPAFMRRLLAPMRFVSSALLREAIWAASRECSLFKATATVAVFRAFGARRVLDISAGWGDRLMGALAAPVEEYVAFDPNPCLREGHDRMREMLGSGATVVRIHYEPFETGAPRLLRSRATGHFDTVFSSPPYFDYENYVPPGATGDGDAAAQQSHARFPEVGAWQRGFLHPALEICARALRAGGNMLIHLDDGKGREVVGPMVRFVESELPGMSHRGTLYLEGAVAARAGPRPVHWFAKKSRD